jgi:hypothetical protein
MSVSINGTSGLVFNDASTQNTAATGFGFKNRLINSAMVIDQRNAGASVTPTDGQYSVDRWQGKLSAASKFSFQQNAGSVTPPAGFRNYLGVTSLAATSLGASDYFFIQQVIEGFNTADLNWGTASAQTVTLSFWVRSSLTGTFGGSLRNEAASRSYPFSYTISSANTWEQKSVTIAGDTTGTWVNNNGAGIQMAFSLGAGSTYSGTAGSWSANNYVSATGATSVVGTNGATLYITGVQLEKGSTATSFDYRPYGTELALCQRYYQNVISTSMNGAIYQGTAASMFCWLPVTMRTAPAATTPASLTNAVDLTGTGYQTPTSLTQYYVTTNSYALIANSLGAGSVGSPTVWSGGTIKLSAEL